MSIDHIMSGIYNSGIEEIILIGDNITLLDYEHQFMGSLHVVDSRSRTSSTWGLIIIYIRCWSVVDFL